MDRLEGIKIFVRVVESGSFSAVARELGTGQPAISKQVAALEERLGAQLLMRTSRSLSLTEAGRDFYESAVPLISDLEAAESRIRLRPGLAVWRGARHRRARLLSPLCRAETTFVPRALSQGRSRDAGLRADEQSHRRRHRPRHS